MLSKVPLGLHPPLSIEYFPNFISLSNSRIVIGLVAFGFFFFIRTF